MELSDQGGDFNAPFAFSVTSASYTKALSGYSVIVLPFEANVPVGVQAYNMLPSSSKVLCTSVPNGKIPANTPVLINGNGTFTFTGSGSVSTTKAIVSNQFNADYSTVKAYTGGYVLKTVGGVTGFYKISSGSDTVPAFSAYISEENAYSASLLPLEFETLVAQDISDSKLQLYPNHAKNEIFINWKSSDAAYSIIDANGSLISHQSKLVSGKNRIEISKLTSGVYFIEIYEAGKSIRTKFIKQ